MPCTFLPMREARREGNEVQELDESRQVTIPSLKTMGIQGICEKSRIARGTFTSYRYAVSQLDMPTSQLHAAVYKGELNPWVKSYVCLVLEFALPPFSPPLPSVVEVLRQNRH